MDNSYISELLSTDGYIQVNRKLIKLLGLHEAIIVGELCSEYNYWNRNNGLEEDGSFYSTRDNIENLWSSTDRFFAGVPKIPNAKKDSMAIYLCFIHQFQVLFFPNLELNQQQRIVKQKLVLLYQ